MKLNNDNPCIGCPNAGCGKQAHCSKYMQYFNNNAIQREKRLKTSTILNDYTRDAVNKAKEGQKKSWKMYRPYKRGKYE